MEFNINFFKNAMSVPLSFQETIAVPSVYGLCENKLSIAFIGAVIKKTNFHTEFYTLEGRLETVMALNCDKCLERFDIPLQLEVNESFIRRGSVVSGTAFSEKALPSETPIPEDFFYFDGESIDFTQALETLVYLNIPPRVVCGEGCKGLCLRCGYNLNQGDCGCDEAIIDSRFLVLHSFFKDKEV